MMLSDVKSSQIPIAVRKTQKESSYKYDPKITLKNNWV